MGWLTGSKPAAKSSKCPHCGKPRCSGRCWDTMDGKEKARVKVTGKDGRTRTVTRNTGNDVRRGIVWCGRCGCRVSGGTCSNVTCSSRRA